MLLDALVAVSNTRSVPSSELCGKERPLVPFFQDPVDELPTASAPMACSRCVGASGRV